METNRSSVDRRTSSGKGSLSSPIIGGVKADDQRTDLEARAGAFVKKQLARWDVHAECKAASRCLAVGYTELGENEWEELTKGLPAELVDDDDESTRAQEILGEAFRAAWLAEVKPCK
jgi:hypothetical protein